MEKRIQYNKKMTRCLKLLVVFLTVSCNRIDSLIEKGEVNLLLGDYHRAEQYFSAAVDGAPRSRSARIGMGKALLQHYTAQSGDGELVTECIVQLEAARSIEADTAVEKLLGIAWLARANDLLQKKDTLAALSALSRSIAHDNTSIQPLNLAGILYFKRGDSKKALSLFNLVVGIDSLSPTGYFNAGMVYWVDSSYSSAYKHWFKAAQCSPADEEIVLWAARAKKQLKVSKP